MRPFILATAAGLALVQGFIIPSKIGGDGHAANTLPVGPLAAVVKLDCPGCPVTMPHRADLVTTRLPSHLELNFSVEHGDRLLVNGFEIYPNADPFHRSLTAPHVVDLPDAVEEEEMDARPHHHNPMTKPHPPSSPSSDSDATSPAVPAVSLGYALRTAVLARDEFVELIVVELSVLELGTTFVHGVPTVRLELLKALDGPLGGRLAIVSAETISSAAVAPRPPTGHCGSFFCRWLAKLEKGLEKYRSDGSGGRWVAKLEKGLEKLRASSCGGRGRGRHGNHGHHDKQNQHGQHVADGGNPRTWSHLVKNITAHILLPVLIGILAGVVVSLVGMAVGTSLIFLWRAFFRRRRQRHHHRHHRHHGCCHKAARREAAVSEEKAGLVDNQEMPPAYEDGDAAAPKDGADKTLGV